MTSFTGTSVLVVSEFRRDRVRIIAWIASIVAMVGMGAASVADLFPTQADIDNAAALSTNPAIKAFNGPAQGLDTLGGQVAFQLGAPVMVIVALMALLMTVRMTRSEEEAGRLELVRSLPVGHHAPLASAAVVVSVMALAVGVLTTAVLAAQSLPLAGSVSLGVSYGITALLFGAIALVAAQMTENTRLAGGIAGAVLGASFVLRGAGDAGNGFLAWFSPIGWMQKARPYAGETWWPFLLAVCAVGVLSIGATRLNAKRDLGAGLMVPSPGPVNASQWLRSAVSLGVRTQRGALLAWTFGVAVFGVAYGSITTAIEDFVEDNEVMADMFIGDSNAPLIESYLSNSTRIVALIGAGFATQSILRMRSDETAGRTELLLAASVSRTRWMLSHLVVAIGGALIVLLATGVAVGGSAAIVTREGSIAVDGIASSLAYFPAVMVLIGIAALFVGVWPRAAAVGWFAMIGSLVLIVLGPLLALPSWADQLSPFAHVPLMPAESFDVGAFVIVLAIGVGLAAVGLLGVRRRDIG